MRTARSRVAVAVVVVVAPVLLTGCGGSRTGPSAGASPSAASSTGAAPAAPGAGSGVQGSPAPASTSVAPTTPTTPTTPTPGRSTAPAVYPPPVDAPVAGLREATTFTSIVGAGTVGAVVLDGVVLHPRTAVAVFSSPGGPAVAALPVTELGSPTWVPVLREVGGWSQVLLPSRPNGSTGWVASGDHSGYDLARSDAVVRVSLVDARMSIDRDGREVGSWPVVVGAPGTPTPAGTTFLMASVDDPGNAYSRYLLPLGWHSDTLDTFGGGPGTVALHGWRDRSVFTRSGRALSHGCVRVPAAALSVARSLPLGTPVVIR